MKTYPRKTGFASSVLSLAVPLSLISPPAFAQNSESNLVPTDIPRTRLTPPKPIKKGDDVRIKIKVVSTDPNEGNELYPELVNLVLDADGLEFYDASINFGSEDTASFIAKVDNPRIYHAYTTTDGDEEPTYTWDITSCKPGEVRAETGECLEIEDKYESDPYGPDLEEVGNSCGPKTDSASNSNDHYGNPIFPLSSAKVQVEDLGISIGGHTLKMVYDSSQRYRATESLPIVPNTQTFDFGILWASSLHRSLIVRRSIDNIIDGATVMIGGGRQVNFSLNVNGKYDATPLGIPYRLVKSGDGFLFYDLRASTIDVYDGIGRLSKSTSASGNYLTFVYSDAATDPEIAPKEGLMVAASDPFGRTIEFHYVHAGAPELGLHPVVYRIKDPNGGFIRFDYVPFTAGNPRPGDTKGVLKTVKWQDDQGDQDNHPRTFNYGCLSQAMTCLLENIVDEVGLFAYATFSYDNAGNATATFLGVGQNKFAATAEVPATWETTEARVGNKLRRTHKQKPPIGLRVQSPNGSWSDIGTELVAGKPRVTSRTQPAGAGCAESQSSTAYDVNGNAIDMVSFGGKRTCANFDTVRGLETHRLSGLLKSEACPASIAGHPIGTKKQSKVTTEWHPDWRIKTAEAKAGLITRWVYNGQTDPQTGLEAKCAPEGALLPDGVKRIVVLCKEIRQATTDKTGTKGFAAVADGVARVTTYRYTTEGAMLERVGPGSSANKISLAYYAATSFSGSEGHYKGDLKTVKDQNGFLTTINKYNRAGQPLLVTLPSDETRVYEYWPRGQIKSETIRSADGGTSLTQSFAYYPTGLLETHHRFDGTALSYHYDEAHRWRQKSLNQHYFADRIYRPSGMVEHENGYTYSNHYEFDALERVQKFYVPLPSPFQSKGSGVRAQASESQGGSAE